MKTLRFKVNGLQLHCLDYGGEGKPPLFFLHGGSAHAHWWDFVGPAFTDAFHVLALDQRGHGESEWASEWAYGSRHYVSDLDQIIKQWGFGAPILVGHSMGAHNVLLYAAEDSHELAAIIIIDTLPEYTDLTVKFLRTFAEKPPRRFSSLDEAVANFKIMPRETLAKKEIIDHMACHTFRQYDDDMWTYKVDRRTLVREPLSVWDGLPRISCPALVVKIADSTLMTREAAQQMVTALPKGRYAEIGNSFHHVMLDNPAALIAVMRNFLTGLKGSGQIPLNMD
jgi:pimeloyl-ACP methyl ester carboxylesterase